MLSRFADSRLSNIYGGSKWVRYGCHVIGGTLFLPTYCSYASCISALIAPYHLDAGQWVRQNLPTMLLCGLFLSGVSGFSVWNRPQPRLTRGQSIVVIVLAILLLTSPVLTSLLFKRV